MLFFHLTTHIEGEKNEKLYEEKGGGGFPAFLVLDEKGDVIVKHAGERSVAEFGKTIDRAANFMAVRKKAEGGDKPAGIDLAIAKLDLGMIKAEEAKKAIAELGEPTKEQQARLDAALLNAEVTAIATAAGKDRASAGRQFNDMKAAGKIPTGTSERMTFWGCILDWAEAEGDAAAFEEALGKLREAVGANANKKYFETKEATLKKLKSKK
ncbi:MAG: hypothetical protein IT452_00660 [Planctomycetia bacterium]|nr:hypothetical protein [Planctomycetia bacterium]